MSAWTLKRLRVKKGGPWPVSFFNPSDRRVGVLEKVENEEPGGRLHRFRRFRAFFLVFDVCLTFFRRFRAFFLVDNVNKRRKRKRQ